MGSRTPLSARIGCRSRASRSAQASAPARLGDQVLPDLDQRIGEAAGGGDRVDRVADERPVIGLVVADCGLVEVVLGAERPEQGGGRCGRRGPTRPRFSMTAASPRQIGVKEWIAMSAGGSPVGSIASTVALTVSR